MAERLETYDETPAAEAQPPETHLSEYLDLILKRRKLILVCIALALTAGVVATLVTKPAYQGTVVLDIVKGQSDPLSFNSSQGGDTDPEFLPSQIQLMRSREIGERVVRKLNLLANPDFSPERYARFRPDAKGNVVQPTRDELISGALEVQRNIDAVNVRGTTLVQISYSAPTSRLSAEIANEVAEAYIAWNIESRFRDLGQSSQFLAGQVEQAKAELDTKEKELLSYGRQKDISPDAQSSGASQKLDSLSHDLDSATADRVAKEARYNEVQKTSAETLADMGSGGAITQMRSEIDRLERDYNDKLNVYKPEWPAMQQLKAQIERARQTLATTKAQGASKAIDSARTDYLTALRREESLKGMTRVQRSQALAQGGDAVEYKNLRVEIDTKRALLDNLLKKQGEIDVISRLRDQQMTNVRIVDRALPPGAPYKPSLKKSLLIAVVLGGILGVGLAFLLSYLDRTLRTPEQVEKYLELPSLGVIPAVEESSGGLPILRRRGFRLSRKPEPVASDGKGVIELLPHEDPRSVVAEAYREFRTSLLLSRAGGVRSIVVTSGFPQEGKTTTAINLAVVLGQLGRRVLLVDADLHQSRIHEVFQLSSRVGLVSVLAENLEPSRSIVKTNLPGVYVVPAGPETPNPSGLLSSDAMRKFLELAMTNFDHIVIDTPPILLLSDALVFAQQTDGLVLCVHGGVTPREQVLRTRDRVLRSGVPILGVLINALAPQAGGYYQPYEYGERPRGDEEHAVPRIAQTS